MNIDKKQLKIISLEFRTIANRLINYLKSSSGTVELRRAKFEGSGTLGYFIPGTGVIVLSRNADEGWAYIQVGSTKGYVDLANLNRNP